MTKVSTSTCTRFYLNFLLMSVFFVHNKTSTVSPSTHVMFICYALNAIVSDKLGFLFLFVCLGFVFPRSRLIEFRSLRI